MTPGTEATPHARTPVRDDLADLVPYGAPQLDVPVRLNTNETAEPPPDVFLAEVGRRIQSLDLNRYPDRPHTRLRELLAGRVDLDVGQTWAANGSNEVLMQLLQAYGGRGRRLASVRPGYSMYPVLARVSATEFVEVDLADDFGWDDRVVADLAAADADVVFVANPNNPTGMRVPAEVLAALHDAVAPALLVVDEAYVEFGGASVVEHVGTWDRLVVSRTFSKAFRLAGLRLGYLHGPDWVVQDLRRVRLPYHLDALKQVAAEVAIEQEQAFLGHRQRVADERDRVIDALRALDEVHAWPSDANFVLWRVPDAPAVFDALLDRGVLVRDFSSKPRLDDCLRVTIGTASENDEFLAALADVLASS
ncbi:histidinol-phosphate transaminase [Salsipaludibacter albus]|uniref:histidinol-phosphate transaminase n=1 Tax=Salsipaludibacter albus TaxID=2849650 RepID=UPI001EE3C4AB|nr:histidinol-phosphate transaminase [Salsipaludibacter albus]